MTIEPLNDYVVVEVIKNENEGGGVYLPEAHKKEEFGMGLVLAADPDNLAVNKGDHVLFDKYLLITVKVEGENGTEEVKFIKFDDIMGIVKPEDIDVSK